MLMLARQDRRAPVDDDMFDWWWIPLDGRPPVKMGVLGLLGVNRAVVVEPASWTSSGLVVFAFRGDVWSGDRVSMSDGRVAWICQQADCRYGGEAMTPTVSQDGTVVFASVNQRRGNCAHRWTPGGSASRRSSCMPMTGRFPSWDQRTADGSMIESSRAFLITARFGWKLMFS